MTCFAASPNISPEKIWNFPAADGFPQVRCRIISTSTQNPSFSPEHILFLNRAQHDGAAFHPLTTSSILLKRPGKSPRSISQTLPVSSNGPSNAYQSITKNWSAAILPTAESLSDFVMPSNRPDRFFGPPCFAHWQHDASLQCS